MLPYLAACLKQLHEQLLLSRCYKIFSIGKYPQSVTFTETVGDHIGNKLVKLSKSRDAGTMKITKE